MTETTQPDPQVAAYEAALNTIRRSLTVADIPAGQGPASLFIQPTTRGIPGLWRRRSDGGVTYITDQKLVDPALWDHLAATLPHVTAEEGA